MPAWGSEWKRSVQQTYHRTLTIGTQGSVMSYRDAYLNLDPTYRDSFGQPLLRITFDWHDNDLKMCDFVTRKAEAIARATKPDAYQTNPKKPGTRFDTRVYQSTHTSGGAIMGTTPANSVVNRYLQSWDVHNLFVTGAG